MEDAPREDVEPEPVARRSIEQATRLALGALGAAVDVGARLVGPASEDGPAPAEDARAAVGDVVVGAAAQLQERLLDASERAASLLGRTAPLTDQLRKLPGVRPVSEAVGRRVDEMAARGAAEREASKAVLANTVDESVGEVVRSEFLAGTVEQVVAELLPSILEAALPDVMDRMAAEPELLVPMIEALLDPMLDTALPEVIAKLNRQPEVVRELVLGQSVSIAGEMAEEVRSRGVTADDLAERVARRLTFRRPRPELARAPRALGAGATRTEGGGPTAGGNGDQSHA